MFLPASTAAFNLVDTDQFWVEAQPKETELTDVRPGEPATITVDTYPGQEWRGTVASISPAAQSEFSLLPAQNTSGNWVKVVQRIPVKIVLDPISPDVAVLRPGMNVDATVITK
jgi:membrane fusion protein (multidrug efflux system)